MLQLLLLLPLLRLLLVRLRCLSSQSSFSYDYTDIDDDDDDDVSPRFRPLLPVRCLLQRSCRKLFDSRRRRCTRCYLYQYDFGDYLTSFPVRNDTDQNYYCCSSCCLSILRIFKILIDSFNTVIFFSTHSFFHWNRDKRTSCFVLSNMCL